MAKDWKIWKTKYQWHEKRIESLVYDLSDFMLRKENSEIETMSKENFKLIDKALTLFHAFDASKLKDKFESLPFKPRKKLNKCFWKLKKWINKNSKEEKKKNKVIKHLKKIESIFKEYK